MSGHTSLNCCKSVTTGMTSPLIGFSETLAIRLACNNSCPTSRKCTQRIHPTRFAPSILLKLSSTNKHLPGSVTPACCIACNVRFVRLSVIMRGGSAANLQVKCWLWLTRNVFFTVITEHNAFHLIAQTQDLQDTFCMLPSTSSQTSDDSVCPLTHRPVGIR